MSDHAILICKLIGFSQRIWDLKRLLKEKTRWFKAVCPPEVLTLPCRWHTSCATAAWCSMLADKTAAQNQMESLTYSDTISYYSNVLQFQKIHKNEDMLHVDVCCIPICQLHAYMFSASKFIQWQSPTSSHLSSKWLDKYGAQIHVLLHQDVDELGQVDTVEHLIWLTRRGLWWWRVAVVCFDLYQLNGKRVKAPPMSTTHLLNVLDSLDLWISTFSKPRSLVPWPSPWCRHL